jgi:DNA-binding MarR family transcriptional regulator
MEDTGVLAWAALLRAHAGVLDRLEQEMQAQGHLPLSWYDVMLSLSRARRPGLRMQDVAEAVVLSRTRVSRVVDEMERAGLVQREPNPADGRSTMVALTRAGRTAFRSAATVYLRGIRQHFADLLSSEDLRCVQAALEKVATAHQAPR